MFCRRQYTFHNKPPLNVYSLPFYSGNVKKEITLKEILQKGFTLKKNAVIHHTATSLNTKPENIRDYHIKHNGWQMCGYHFIIVANGDIYWTRPLTKKGAHAKGRNNLVGICLTGYDRFTTAQIESLRGLLKRLGIVEIEPHHEKCPGKGLNLEQIQKEIE